MNTIDWADFEKVELRIGTIVEVLDFPQASTGGIVAPVVYLGPRRRPVRNSGYNSARPMIHNFG